MAIVTPPTSTAALNPAAMPKVIRAGRVTLRCVMADDAPLISKYCSDYDVAKMTSSFPYPLPLLSAEVLVMMRRAAWREGRSFSYAIDIEGESGLAGVMTLFKRAPEEDWELGYWLGRPYWRQGLAAIAARAAMQAFTDTYGPTAFQANIFSDNPASGRVLEKLGFTATGPCPEVFSMARLRKVGGYSFHLASGDLS